MKNKRLAFCQADVFTKTPYHGNPVAVIIDGDQLTDQEMQLIANWTNLSETTFICSPTNPEADYRLRIFTPCEELPFAGHPTIGSARVALSTGIVPKNPAYLVQECKQGLVRIYLEDERISFAMPEVKTAAVDDGLQSRVSKALGVKKDTAIVFSEIVDVGAVWFTIQLASAEDVLALQPNDERLIEALADHATGVTVFALQNKEAQVEVRSFAPLEGVHEDPVCGSGNGAVAVLIKKHHLLKQVTYTASQGQKVGRAGIIDVNLDYHGQILIGGHAVECISGQLALPQRS